ncbi:GpE protein [Novosphingobium sp. GV055]|nr:GpE family phage tail protein [Novosphingobium sp. GV055]PTR05482.1 GpE protein [Novosphingobium sp. GV055]PUA94040.1 GpE protein [Novosphingobium sp. GV061]PUB11627.1 GpE protein [Novosphingobium sp. GV079]PUB37101.1 GpE protein [Novosphingobium sp. GV027]
MADIALVLHFSFEAMSAWPLETLGHWHARALARLPGKIDHE